MTKNEETYLTAFRALLAQRKKIMAMIAELRTICESLKDWTRTASDLSSLGSMATRPEWSEARLKGIITLRDHLIGYHQLAEEATRAWSNLTLEERAGFAEPASVGTLAP